MKTSPKLHITGNVLQKEFFEALKRVPIELKAHQGDRQPFRFKIRHCMVMGEIEFEIDQLAARQIAGFIISHLKIDEKCIQ